MKSIVLLTKNLGLGVSVYPAYHGYRVEATWGVGGAKVYHAKRRTIRAAAKEVLRQVLADNP